MLSLLEERYAPITGAIGFVNAPIEESVAALVDWYTSLGRVMSRTLIAEQFPLSLHALEPLDHGWQPRTLFVQTRDPLWTAVFGSGRQGTDPSPIAVLAEKVGTRTVWTDVSPDTLRPGKPGGRYGGVQLRINDVDVDGKRYEVRSIWATRDGVSRWGFGQHGEAQPFETPETYDLKRKRSRFTSFMLRDYCAAIGIHLFDADFYSGDSVLTEFPVVHRPDVLLRTLAEEQASLNLIFGEADSQRE